MYLLRHQLTKLARQSFTGFTLNERLYPIRYDSTNSSDGNKTDGNKTDGNKTDSNKTDDKKEDEVFNKQLVVRNAFEDIADKNKSSYLTMVEIFLDRDVHRRNHVEFIYAALKNMESFGVHRDLEVYKALMNVMPKEKFIPRNMFQAEFMHYPKQQQCMIDLLEQMEDNGR